MEQKDLELLNQFLTIADARTQHSTHDDDKRFVEALYRVEKEGMLESDLLHKKEDTLQIAFEWACQQEDQDDYADGTDLTWDEISQPDFKDTLLDVFINAYGGIEAEVEGEKVYHLGNYEQTISSYLENTLPHELTVLMQINYDVNIDESNAIPDALRTTQSMLLKADIKQALEEEIPKPVEQINGSNIAVSVKTQEKTRQRRM